LDLKGYVRRGPTWASEFKTLFSLGPAAPSYPLFYSPEEGLDAVWIPAKLHSVASSGGIVFRR